MKFQLAINMERLDASVDMREVECDTLEIVQMADAGGFETVWAAEHHALEMTIAPNPFQILTWWAAHTNDIRLGTAVAVAPYWHPVNLAGEAALCDLYSGGRLDFGIGSGAYQREFDIMRPGLKQTEGYLYMQEMLPVLKALWQGDYAHDGEHWQFPTATSVPKPVQKPHPPIWAAARAPVTYDYAVEHECNIMAWPFTRPFDEVEAYAQRLADAMAKHPGKPRPTFAMMRHACIYDSPDGLDTAITSLQRTLGQFENLYQNLGDVKDGFPKEVDLASLKNRDQYDPEMLQANLMFGTPDEIIKKLKPYEDIGVDSFILYTSMNLPPETKKKSIKLFVDEVMPAFK